MRILISGVPGHGHLLPLLPLARAFRRREDSVAIMVPPSYVPVFVGQDIEVLVAGADNPTVIAEVLRRTGEDVRGECTRDAVIEAFATARIDLSVDYAVPVARDWGPDLVVHDVMDFVGPFVAIACGAIRASTERSMSDYRDRGIRWLRLFPQYLSRRRRMPRVRRSLIGLLQVRRRRLDRPRRRSHHSGQTVCSGAARTSVRDGARNRRRRGHSSE